MKKWIVLALLSMGGMAYADANAKKLCSDNVGLEKGRLAELERTSKWDHDALKQIDETIHLREASSAKFAAKAQELNSVLGLLTGQDKADFDDFAKADTVYSNHDKELADQLKAASADLKKQLELVDTWINDHKAHIAKVEARCKLVK